MDEYDEMLVKWFDYDFWPMVARELAGAERMEKACKSTALTTYWRGYIDAMDMISRYIDGGMERIKAAVEEEEDSDD